MHPGIYAEKDPAKPAYIMAGSGQVISYGELEAASNQGAHLLRSLGLERGDHIAICMENHPRFLQICWSAFRSGLYITAISYRLQPAEVEYIVTDCGARVLVISSFLSDTYDGLKGKINPATRCFMTDGTVAGCRSWEEAIAAFPATPIEDQAYGQSLLYSSGTTGRPKGIKKPLTEIPFGEENPLLRPAQNRYEYGEETVYLSPAPLYHSAPL